jgi:hypothetical protein
MHSYACPKCKTILKRQEPVPPGKKMKCPKCQKIFAPDEVKQQEEDETNPYKVVEDEAQEELLREEKTRAAMGRIKDPYKKSARGPALAKVVQPAGWLLTAGIVLGAICLATFVVGIFPIAFKSYYLDTPQYKKMDPSSLQLAWEDIVVTRIIIMSIAVVGLTFASLITVGGYKMRTLESYGWAMTGSILAIMLGFGIFTIIGIWCVITLRDKAVIAGFEEEPPPEHLSSA